MSTPRPALAEANPFVPPAAADPPARPGSANDPQEPLERASPTARERYPAPSKPSGKPTAKTQKRPLPSYGPRAPSDSSESAWWWVPRVLLFPVYAVSEYVVRRPLGALMTYAEAHRWPTRLIDLLTWDDQRAGILPTVVIDDGFRPSVGLYLFWDDFLATNNHIRLTGDFGGEHWYRARFVDRVELPGAQQLSFKTSIGVRPDLAFWGLGPDSPWEPLRYGATHFDGVIEYLIRRWRSTHAAVTAGVRHVRLDPNAYGAPEPTLDDAIASGRLDSLPAGIEGYTVLYEELEAILDTRPRREAPQLGPVSDFLPLPGTGARAALLLRNSGELEARDPAVARTWITYGFSAGGWVDLTGEQRTLGMKVTALFADPVGYEGEIPFVELPSLGGSGSMRGFYPMRVLGRSTIAAELDYRWPVWATIDGNFDVGLGNAFGEHLEGAAWRKLRLSADFGIRAINDVDRPLEMLIGFGTAPFDQGLTVESARFVLSTATDF